MNIPKISFIILAPMVLSASEPPGIKNSKVARNHVELKRLNHLEIFKACCLKNVEICKKAAEFDYRVITSPAMQENLESHSEKKEHELDILRSQE